MIPDQSNILVSHHAIPDVKVHEGLEAGDVVRDALDGVVVEQQPLQALVLGAF